MYTKINHEKKSIPSATVIIVCDSDKGLQVLMLRRSLQLEFGSGYWVFPGGKINKMDYKAGINNIHVAARIAAIRESKEEAGLVLNENKLIFTSHWTSPQEMKTRFSTWYYVTEINKNIDICIDNSEIIQYQWYKPSDALLDFNDKKIKIMAPTFVTLSELSNCKNVVEALAICRRNPTYYTPKTIKLKNGFCSLYKGDSGYQRCDQNIKGKHHRLLLLNEKWHYIKDI